MTTLLVIMKYVSRQKSAAVKDIDIDIADILGQKYRYRIDIGHGDIDPPLIDITQFLRHGSNKFSSIFKCRIIGTCTVHHLSAFVGLQVASLVMLHNGHIRVDVVVALRRVMDEAPAVVMMHINTRCWIDNRFHRVTRRTQ